MFMDKSMMRKRRNIEQTNKSGQRLGPKGSNTRARVLECLAQLLEETRGVAPTSASVARASGTSPAGFYIYFSDVGEALVALLETRGQSLEVVVEHLSEPWPHSEIFDRASRFVNEFMGYWHSNAALLRARNRLADQGDNRFIKLRVESVEQLTRALSAKISGPTTTHDLPFKPDAMATVIVTALERLATVVALQLYPQHADDQADLINALAHMVTLAMREQPAQI